VARPLARSYTLIAPIYDALVARATEAARRESLARLVQEEAAQVLLVGVGTGLDLPLLPSGPQYAALDLNRAMLRWAAPRAASRGVTLVQGDAGQLPFADASFDAVVLHLIVAVIPEPASALREALRVTRKGGCLLVFDKFLRPGETALLRRLMHPLVSRIATRLDVVWEDVLAQAPGGRQIRDEPALAGGWFRRIELRKD
jgi:ubiquinone/menaquinone biosynthesis C-methylase UbiE